MPKTSYDPLCALKFGVTNILVRKYIQLHYIIEYITQFISS